IMPKTLNPQWREQFDFHLYEERGGIIDITAWDKDAGKRDDFIGRRTQQASQGTLGAVTLSVLLGAVTLSVLLGAALCSASQCLGWIKTGMDGEFKGCH
ncbi:hypothetical protein MC885_017923, partial [Smutsia gigantea]